MSQSDTDWQPVATALLGSWPSQVASWGREALSAYLAEVGARGVTPEQALVAIRCCPGEQKFPPSAPELAALARRDPSTPTFDEALTLVRSALRAYNRPLTGTYDTEAQMLGARERNVLERAESLGVPLVAAFVARHGVDRLLDEVGELDGQYGAIRRKELEAAWDRHCEALEGRDVAALVTGRRGGIGHLDPLAALSGVRPVAGELEAGER